ncbi:hypothetical protein BCR37DRAFT_395294 [Protomyces lactucae-debilis]|uniref:Uncharacterized protein n=1 Tax=Protomyces lactucae-debilis TaxID=2754530 RepID=A0A1Y2EXR1_PROLT|nr:uncharacterized protein BCR37DRAFT_395294 [Protomyces lactucae-debilis]ORY76360.1 hypothetical protein BCR37DRAFT_395294 [Protomyces lactucae-debilis]
MTSQATPHHTYALRSVTTLPDLATDEHRQPRRKTSMWNLFKRRGPVEDQQQPLPSPRDAFRSGSGSSGRASPSPSLASTIQTPSSQASLQNTASHQPGDLFNEIPRMSGEVRPARVLRSTKSHYNLRTNRSVFALESWEAAEFETSSHVSWVTSTGRRQIGLCD